MGKRISQVFILLVIITGIFSINACSCSCGAKENFFHGKVVIVGNEPFTAVALKNEKGEIIVLKCDPDTEKLLRSSQGKIFVVEYDNVVKTPNGEAAIVNKAEELNSDLEQN